MKRHYVVRPTHAPAAEPADSDWRSRAACTDEDPDLFFPLGSTGPAAMQINEAKTVCARCPVMATCRKEALDTGQEYGVWGGLSENERQALQRREALAHTAA